MATLWKQLLEEWGLESLSVNIGIAKLEFKPSGQDAAAAWSLFVELVTRVAIQPLPEDHGDEAAALESLHQLFGITREVLRDQGPRAQEFAKIAVVVLNQVVRPFTAKWHRLQKSSALTDPQTCREFRAELATLQETLVKYAMLLGDMAGVTPKEDLRQLVLASILKQ